jgi:hypothetical protein
MNSSKKYLRNRIVYNFFKNVPNFNNNMINVFINLNVNILYNNNLAKTHIN